ncbi:MAG: nucleotidyltransferase family protein [Magnetococcales bacterium]|nr:nucleotidyltransferase family protein [Magnetococcales bacterium]
MKHDWRKVLVGPELPIFHALEIMNQGAIKVVIVVDENRHLLGIVTDGDVRRGFLNRIDLHAPIRTVMSPNPTVARVSESHESIRSMMGARGLEHIPVVDDAGRLVGLNTLSELARPQVKDNWVVLMAGGLGTRLGRLTEQCPKPLLHVGAKPILEIILESFIQHGFHRFFMSVNYRKEMIQSHFGDGSRWGVTIEYLEENDRLGTAGSLSLLPDIPDEPFFVMNGDLLTRINFSNVLEFHKEHEADATLCVRKVEQTVPYGVVETDAHRLVNIVEKPVQAYYVNAGIYLLSPQVISFVPESGYFDMTDLFRKLVELGRVTAAFSFLEYWLDIGRLGDFQQACQDYPKVFE